MHKCCGMLDSAVGDEDIPIIYVPHFREYGVSILDGGTSYLLISYCPWCGSKLPESKRLEWFEVLEQLGLEPGDSEIPAEMLREAWWQNPKYARKV